MFWKSLYNGAKPNILLSTGNYGSALAAAAYEGRFDVVRVLISKGADPNQLLSTGIYGSGLVAAAAAGRISVLEYLIHEAKADANFLTEHHGRYGSPLAAAANLGNIKSVKILLRAGADPNLVLENPCFSNALHASQADLYPSDQELVEYKVSELTRSQLDQQTPVAEAKAIVARVLENLARLHELERHAPGLLEDSGD
ncbi:uncharacterized protein N7483_007914 [Penicillium malachiteum]|uniref:uncharacterized protein n=1 Tax=Penicillium malachiteum TaxID=1324776 RepID=UPI002548D93D|nr:uncharacterized protein N7483_007914 [Penicillium malachiteum]KAJ5726557.1 hypothetical protein N7483_007914 [Penicillium malachiteum]